MRLIDADRLKEELSLQWLIDILLTNRNSADVLSALTEKIDSQSTAYGVDKVVEQFKCDDCDKCSFCEVCAGSTCCGMCNVKAIVIVKAGGVDAKTNS